MARLSGGSRTDCERRFFAFSTTAYQHPRRRFWNGLAVLFLMATQLAVVPAGKSAQPPDTTNGAVSRNRSVNKLHAAQADRSRLVAEYLLDGNLDDGARPGQAAKSQGQVAFDEGRHGQCLRLAGNAWLDTGLSQQLLGKEFTIECWVRPEEHQAAHADIFGNHVSETLGIVLQQDAGKTNHYLAAYGTGSGQWILTDSVYLTPNRWQHLAMVKSSSSFQIYINGILADSRQATTDVGISPMPITIGLGYTDSNRCFRGCIDDFRIWNLPIADFSHADIDPLLAQRTRAQYLNPTPRPAVGPCETTWSLATQDTSLSLGMTSAGQLAIVDLHHVSGSAAAAAQKPSAPTTTASRNWIARPVAIKFPSRVMVNGQPISLKWNCAASQFDGDGHELTLTFRCGVPRLELLSKWKATTGPGPIQHSMRITNQSQHTIAISDQPTFDIDLAGVDSLWRFHSDGLTPDQVGIYRDRLGDATAGKRIAIRTSPQGEFIPIAILTAQQQEGVYLGLEWSFCRIDAIALEGPARRTVRVRCGNIGDEDIRLKPHMSYHMRPGFVGAYAGDLDDAGNRLRRWLWNDRVPAILRQDPTYPKVQWNAFGATGKEPGSWDPVEAKFYPLIDDIAPLGFEEVMIDVGWWSGSEPDSDPDDWPSGMRKAADYAHQRGMRFGLYWTDDLKMADATQRQRRANRIRRLFDEYEADMWRSDCTRGEVLDSSYAATLGFYELVDSLSRQMPRFQWENCSGGGRIKDYGAMSRAIKIFNSDTYSALHVRQAFHDSSFVLHPAQLEGHLGSTDGRFRPKGKSGIRFAFRSTSMGAPEWFLDAPNGGNGTQPWTDEEKETLQNCVEIYKQRIRPLVRHANLYHIFPRPDGKHRDGIEYYDAASGQGVVYLFQPTNTETTGPVRWKGLEEKRMYRMEFLDGSNATRTVAGKQLMDSGLQVTLENAPVSELIFLEALP
jgi:hypothetical protein